MLNFAHVDKEKEKENTLLLQLFNEPPGGAAKKQAHRERFCILGRGDISANSLKILRN